MLRVILIPLLMACGPMPKPQPVMQSSPPKEEIARNQLREFTAQIIETTSPNFPDYYKQILARNLTDIALERFELSHQQRAWVSLLAVESKFHRTVTSPKGAVGLGQLLPQYRNDFGKTCGYTDIRAEDLKDSFINAFLSACYFKMLVDKYDGNVALALIAYNAGPNSKDIARAKQGLNVSGEPANYVTKVYIKEGQGND